MLSHNRERIQGGEVRDACWTNDESCPPRAITGEEEVKTNTLLHKQQSPAGCILSPREKLISLYRRGLDGEKAHLLMVELSL